MTTSAIVSIRAPGRLRRKGFVLIICLNSNDFRRSAATCRSVLPLLAPGVPGLPALLGAQTGGLFFGITEVYELSRNKYFC